MTAPQITPLPPAPQRQNAPADFVVKADAHVASLVGFVSEANTQATFNDGRATASDDSAAASEVSNLASGVSASSSAVSASAALISEGNASDSADSAQVSAAAAGAAAGLPSLAGNANKALLVTSSELGVEWAVAGSLIFATEAVISNDATIDFNLPGGFSKYVFEFLNVSTPAIGTLFLRTSTDGGVTFDSGASDYAYTNRVLSTDATDGTTSQPSTLSVLLANSYLTISGTVSVYSPSSASPCHVLFELAGEKSTGSKWSFYRGMGTRKASSDVDAIRFYNSSGTITSGIIRLYGII